MDTAEFQLKNFMNEIVGNPSKEIKVKDVMKMYTDLMAILDDELSQTKDEGLIEQLRNNQHAISDSYLLTINHFKHKFKN